MKTWDYIETESRTFALTFSAPSTADRHCSRVKHVHWLWIWSMDCSHVALPWHPKASKASHSLTHSHTQQGLLPWKVLLTPWVTIQGEESCPRTQWVTRERYLNRFLAYWPTVTPWLIEKWNIKHVFPPLFPQQFLTEASKLCFSEKLQCQ